MTVQMRCLKCGLIEDLNLSPYFRSYQLIDGKKVGPAICPKCAVTTT